MQQEEGRPVVILVGGAFRHGPGDAVVAARLTAHVAVVCCDDRGRGGGRAPSAAVGEAGEFEALIGGAGGVVLVFGAWPGGVTRGG